MTTPEQKPEPTPDFEAAMECAVEILRYDKRLEIAEDAAMDGDKSDVKTLAALWEERDKYMASRCSFLARAYRALHEENARLKAALQGAVITMEAWRDGDPGNNDNYCRAMDALKGIE